MTPVNPPVQIGAFVASVNAVSVTIQTFVPGGKSQAPLQNVQVTYEAFDANSNPFPVSPMSLTGAAAASVVAAPASTQLSVAEAQVVSAIAAQASAQVSPV
jgi:hypothetical protein